MKIGTLTSTFGAILEEDKGLSLAALGRAEEVVELLIERGVLIFRGYQPSLEEFEGLTRLYGRHFINNGERSRQTVASDGNTQTVTAGGQMIAPHAEMGYSPFRPELLWLFFERTASEGGDSILCDGVELWAAIPPDLRDLFSDRRLRYSLGHWTLDQFRPYLGEVESVDQLSPRLRAYPGLEYTLIDSSTVDLTYYCEAAPPVRFGAARAFANSVLVWTTRLAFEDAMSVDHDVRLRLFQCAIECGITVKMQQGDILLIDNSRVMHGRAPFNDAQRSAYVRMCDAAFEGTHACR